MELEIRERYLSKNDVEVGTSVRFKILTIAKEVKKSKLGTSYDCVVLRLVDKNGEVFKLSCFNSELTACIRTLGKETDNWLGKGIDCFNHPSSTGKSTWRVVPVPVEETVE